MAAAGGLRDRVRILSRSGTTGQYGGVPDTWTTAASVWAHVVSSPPLSDVPAGREVAPVRVAFRVRTRNDVSPAQRVEWQGRYYSIIGIERHADGDRAMMVLHTREVI